MVVPKSSEKKFQRRLNFVIEYLREHSVSKEYLPPRKLIEDHPNLPPEYGNIEYRPVKLHLAYVKEFEVREAFVKRFHAYKGSQLNKFRKNYLDEIPEVIRRRGSDNYWEYCLSGGSSKFDEELIQDDYLEGEALRTLSDPLYAIMLDDSLSKEQKKELMDMVFEDYHIELNEISPNKPTKKVNTTREDALTYLDDLLKD